MANSPGDVSNVYALIALITDPVAAKARLDELKRLEGVAETSAANAKQAATDRAASERALGEARRVAADSAAEAAARKETLDKIEKELEARRAAISAREDAFTASSGQTDRLLKEREQAVSTAERTIGDRDSRSRQLAADIQAEKDAWQEKLRRAQAATAA